MKNFAVPRNCEDRSLVPTFQAIRDSVGDIHKVLSTFDVHTPITPQTRALRVLDNAYGPVGNWSFDVGPGATIVDSSGFGANLALEAGTMRTTTIHPTLGGV